MGKVVGIINGLKFVLKFGVIIVAIVKVVEFAIQTFEDLGIKEDEKKKENE